MSVLAARDDDNATLPVLRRKNAHNLTLSANAPQTIAFSEGTAIVSFWATGTVFLNFGGADVSAATQDDHAHPAGAIDYEYLRNHHKQVEVTHVSVMATEDDVQFYLSERM